MNASRKNVVQIPTIITKVWKAATLNSSGPEMCGAATLNSSGPKMCGAHEVTRKLGESMKTTICDALWFQLLQASCGVRAVWAVRVVTQNHLKVERLLLPLASSAVGTERNSVAAFWNWSW
jgi:hypothetical protein